MITSLSIENFALIESLSIRFSNGFSTITGETGAGKSILLGALGLVLGKRADLSTLKNKDEKCIVEAHFNIQNYNLKPFFEENNLDYEPETILRREILPSGKSRAFINDTPVNLQELQDLGTHLLDIHSQHQTQELSDDWFQFQILDSIAENTLLLNQYSAILKDYKKSKTELNKKTELLQQAIKEQDYNSFLLEELLSARLIPGEQEELENQLQKLNNIELIKENIEKALVLINDDSFGILQNGKEIKMALQKIANFSPEYATLSERFTSLIIELDDIEKEINQQTETVFFDPNELQRINDKLQLIYTLQKKHQVSSIEELLQIQEALEGKVISVFNLQQEIQKLEDNKQEQENQLNIIALEIHHNREKGIPLLTQKLIAILENLGMPSARFKIELSATDDYYQNGKDQILFLFSANKGSDFGVLKKVASGGELSRIMLAVKSILAEYSKLPTILFDEIDTGVSGEIAHKMGEIMKQMSQSMQVFAITHLPQIAAKGTEQYKVFKTIKGEQTHTEIIRLLPDERIVEIAQMLSGSVISESALNHAKSLLN